MEWDVELIDPDNEIIALPYSVDELDASEVFIFTL